ncbi:hypothetical protein E2C01_076143 [Portunus trituberculatus]|uniref:Uncharacterized protein n=1 Tax=Portunus trituberculatus TaxID=210409 RepID=A0A5B7ICF8_PORTR|nr:hypothetical protein [Portunus trituberculatus]
MVNNSIGKWKKADPPRYLTATGRKKIRSKLRRSRLTHRQVEEWRRTRDVPKNILVRWCFSFSLSTASQSGGFAL